MTTDAGCVLFGLTNLFRFHRNWRLVHFWCPLRALYDYLWHTSVDPFLSLMSFFGFEQSDLEKQKQSFLDGSLHESEDLAVYTWGEDSYDGLGDALQEGGDELNDETFGSSDNVGEAFPSFTVKKIS